jgi:hypothetical protein
LNHCAQVVGAFSQQGMPTFTGSTYVGNVPPNKVQTARSCLISQTRSGTVGTLGAAHVMSGRNVARRSRECR